MFVFNHECQVEDLGRGVERKILAHSGSLMSVEVHFDKGAVGGLHSHYHEQITYIVSGTFMFTIGDETQLVNAGDCIYIDPNIIHGCTCHESGVLLDIFTPQRNDFLPFTAGVS